MSGGSQGAYMQAPVSPWQAAWPQCRWGRKRGWEEPYARYCPVISKLCPQGLKHTLNTTHLVPMQLTFKMSDVMVFRGISRGSCMWTSCSSARIQGKS